MDNFAKTMINQMARRTGTELTERHLQILEFAYEYYYKHKVGPLFHMFKNRLGVSKQELQKLFPNGIHSVYNWTGIPIQTTDNICKDVAAVDVKNYRDVYFDHNATTCLRDEVKKVLIDYCNGVYGFGNPSSSTLPGRKAYEHVFHAREQIAETIRVSPREIVFTSSGTEANNLAIKGVAFNYLEDKGHIISCKTEHPSVRNTLEWIAKIGFTVTLLDVDPSGMISPQAVEQALRRDTILVAVMAANNEIGTIHPLEHIGNICASREIPFMVDAIQAYGKIPLNPKKIGISLMSLSGHKIYAPKGVGALFIDRNVHVRQLLHGGEQELGLRAGTENVGHIMALGRAAELMYAEMGEEQQRYEILRQYFLQNLDDHVPGYILNGSRENRLAHTLNVGFPGVDSGALQLSLNKIGIYVSSGAACSAGSKEASHVIKALGVDTDYYGIIRFSFGLHNTEEDIDYLFQYLPEILTQLQQNGQS